MSIVYISTVYQIIAYAKNNVQIGAKKIKFFNPPGTIINVVIKDES